MGSEGSVRAVSQRLGKSRTLIEKWSKRWKWSSRVTAHIDYLARGQVAKGHRGLPDIMSAAELLARASMLARATPMAIIDPETGDWMTAKQMKAAGLDYMISGIKRRKTTYPNGTVTETTEYRVESRVPCGTNQEETPYVTV